MNHPYQFAYSHTNTNYSVVQNDLPDDESEERFLIKLYAVILLLGSTLSYGGSWLTRSSSSTDIKLTILMINLKLLIIRMILLRNLKQSNKFLIYQL